MAEWSVQFLCGKEQIVHHTQHLLWSGTHEPATESLFNGPDTIWQNQYK